MPSPRRAFGALLLVLATFPTGVAWSRGDADVAATGEIIRDSDPHDTPLDATTASVETAVVAAGTDGRRPSCTARHHAGGDWPSLNHDLRNSRHQAEEEVIGVAEAPSLEPAWSFSGTAVNGSGDMPPSGGMRSTPVVADGCVYIGLGQGYLGERGDVIALNADTGELVWHTQLDGSVLGLAAGNGLIYATPSKGTRGDVQMPVVTKDYQPAGSYAVALDGRTGDLVWTSERLDDGEAKNGTFVNASPVVFKAGGRNMVFVPLSGGAGDGARVPMYFLDARDGTTIAKTYSLTDTEYENDFGGTGIWSTAAFDQEGEHLFAGTADSDGRKRQHPYNNAILKIDANPKRPTFGSVVGSYAGTTEHADLDALIGYPNNPACGAFDESPGGQLPTFFDTSAAPECLELDFDFGASPNLHIDRGGLLKVGALQKSGIYHRLDAANMKADWTFPVGPGGAAMDAATAAVDDDGLYIGATPNVLFGLERETGTVGWAATSGLDLFAYQPITVANGVLYAISDSGFLLALAADSGAPLLQRVISVDGDFEQCLGVGAGVAVARNTVYVPCDAGGPNDLAGLPAAPGGLVAYRIREAAQ